MVNGSARQMINKEIEVSCYIIVFYSAVKQKLEKLYGNWEMKKEYKY
jgi:hypothetical protein